LYLDTARAVYGTRFHAPIDGLDQARSRLGLRFQNVLDELEGEVRIRFCDERQLEIPARLLTDSSVLSSGLRLQPSL
jgi:hypothetical protein